jgi:nicotinamidase-related amidase/type 1 glutamine amidotransferase
MSLPQKIRCPILLVAMVLAATMMHSTSLATAETMSLKLRYQEPADESATRFHRQHRLEKWQGEATAVIVCDMWDSHHGYRAALRTAELAPAVNAFIGAARDRGAAIIHAPSGCTAAYEDHPARRRAVATTPANDFPEDVAKWCYQIPAEEAAVYPIDQSAGGEDDTPEEQAAWQQQLAKEGRNGKHPWQRQISTITIDEKADWISDSGEEIWSILKSRGVENVMLVGVHTNMCVLGRPFGLRRMSTAGMNTVLVRDLTDTMYDPRAYPFVSHFTGTDLIVDHIERHVCPTIDSTQLVGGEAFRFADDNRQHVVMVIAETEYRTEQTLPQWALTYLGKRYRVSYCFADQNDQHRIIGLESLEAADLMLISVRRRPLPSDQLELVRRFVASGKPVLGIRTASHAFSVRGEAPGGVAQWPEFDAEVFGGNYRNHHANDLQSTVMVADKVPGELHDLVAPFSNQTYIAGGSLYRTSPLADRTQLLLVGSVPEHPSEPVAWTFERADGGKSFYTSLGHVNDFAQPAFRDSLSAATDWLLTP